MKFEQIVNCLTCKDYHRAEGYTEADVQNVTAGDLMSEVLVYDKDNLLLVTALNSEQALRTASMVDALAVVLVNGKIPNTKMTSLAEDLGITLLATPKSMFEACAALHRLMNEEDCCV